ncbi:MAG TPA: Crp/Fnr family transcriptional regulator [Clostridia bacterium]|nr:Crp/Fnr family transcriptional regulator [Clostridia bacterium]
MNCSCHKRDGVNCIELVPIFSNLNHEEMLEIASITVDRVYKKGEMIYMAGDEGKDLYVIHQGKVKITRFSDTGKEQVIRVLGPGEFMGELSLFSPNYLTDNGEVLEETIVCIIRGEEMKGIISKYPTISFKILEELSQRLEKAENLIESINLQGVERRLAETLINMADHKNEVILKMSKRDLASHIGMSQETLSRKLSSFQDMGLIDQIGHRKIILLDKDALMYLE